MGYNPKQLCVCIYIIYDVFKARQFNYLFCLPVFDLILTIYPVISVIYLPTRTPCTTGQTSYPIDSVITTELLCHRYWKKQKVLLDWQPCSPLISTAPSHTSGHSHLLQSLLKEASYQSCSRYIPSTTLWTTVLTCVLMLYIYLSTFPSCQARRVGSISRWLRHRILEHKGKSFRTCVRENSLTHSHH